MVGVHMGIERGDQAQTEFAQQGGVAPHMLENGIDEHRLTGLGVAEQVGVRRGRRVEELAEDEHGDGLSMEEAGVSAARESDRAAPCR